MLKKIIAILLTVLLMAGLAAGCGNTGNKPDTTTDIGAPMSRYTPEITLTMAPSPMGEEGGYNYLNNPWMDAYKDELGINIVPSWEVDVSTDTTEKLTEQLAIGVVPDIMTGLNRSQFEFVVRLGLAADVTDLLADYGTPLTKEILDSDGGYALQSSSFDGRLYALPYVYGNTDNICMMWIRTDWLTNLDLEYPKTADELYDVFDAFVHDDPDQNGDDDTVGLISTDTLWECGSIFNIFGAQPFWSWYYDENNILKYSTVSFTDNIKKALSFMQRLYQNGLMYKEFGIMSKDKYDEMFTEGKAGIAFEYKYFPYYVQDGVIQSDVDADWEAFPIPTGLPGGAPARPFSYHGPAAYNVISSKCENPEAAVKMLNLFTEKKYSDKSDQYCSQFIVDENGNDLEQYALYSTARANDLSEYEHIAGAVERQDPSQLNFAEKIRYDSCMEYLAGNRESWADYKHYGPGNVSTTILQYYSSVVTPFFSDYYGPDTPSMRQNIAMLDSKWNTTVTRIIMSGEDVDHYDEYVGEWYDLGGQKIEEDINAMSQETSTSSDIAAK
jgi:putative aldouronate transport system substrate-binding protein